MAIKFIFLIFIQFLFFCFSNCQIIECKEKETFITQGNWSVILDNKWLVKFYAPWCPACRNMENSWKEIARISREFCVASADVSENAGLSGRFFITSLPTIYYVDQGQFYLYTGSRSPSSLLKFVEEEKFQNIEPLPWYLHPSYIHMSALSQLFSFSVTLKNTHSYLTSSLGIPWYLSYLFFALVTIICGLILGLLIVCCCDLSLPKKNFKTSIHKKDDDRFISHDNIENLEQEDDDEDEIEEEEEEEEEKEEKQKKKERGDGLKHRTVNK